MTTPTLFEELSHTELRRIRDVLQGAADGKAAGPEVTPVDRVEIIERVLGHLLCRKLGVFQIPAGFKLSVVMPVYNEARTLAKVIERVRATSLPLEIVIVDDGSRDGSREYLAELQSSRDERNADLKIIFHEKNLGKGGAIQTGFLAATGDVVVI